MITTKKPFLGGSNQPRVPTGRMIFKYKKKVEHGRIGLLVRTGVCLNNKKSFFVKRAAERLQGKRERVRMLPSVEARSGGREEIRRGTRGAGFQGKTLGHGSAGSDRRYDHAGKLATAVFRRSHGGGQAKEDTALHFRFISCVREQRANGGEGEAGYGLCGGVERERS